jgi:hypothetical protein
MLPSDAANYSRAATEFDNVANTAMARFQQLDNRVRQGTLSEQEFAAALEADVLKPWNAALDRLAALQHVPDAMRKQWDLYVRYGRLQGTAWQKWIDGLKKMDDQLLDESRRIQESANEVSKELDGQSN